jgi:hypothetical protein
MRKTKKLEKEIEKIRKNIDSQYRLLLTKIKELAEVRNKNEKRKR